MNVAAISCFMLLVQTLLHQPNSSPLGSGEMTGLVCASCLRTRSVPQLCRGPAMWLSLWDAVLSFEPTSTCPTWFIECSLGGWPLPLLDCW